MMNRYHEKQTRRWSAISAGILTIAMSVVTADILYGSPAPRWQVLTSVGATAFFAVTLVLSVANLITLEVRHDNET
jgi:hypothetical protein